jgi:hypothetical protein
MGWSRVIGGPKSLFMNSLSFNRSQFGGYVSTVMHQLASH